MQAPKILLPLLLCLIILAPVEAQDVGVYPTATALQDTVIPIRDRADLARRMLGVTDIPAPPTVPPVYAVGDVETFTATNTTDRHRFTVEATLRAMGEHIALWVENGASMNDADLAALVDAFDTRVYPQVRAMWGSEAIPGIDGDPRVHGLFVRGLGNTTAAYFSSDHTYPREAYPSSNEREMFFFNLDALPNPFSLAQVESIVAHEFQHMIRHNIQLNDDTWLNEGMSEFTQFLLYNDVPSSVLAYLSQPNTQLTDWNAQAGARAANYGGSLLFLIYLYERFGLNAIHDLSLDPSPRGWDSVERVADEYGDINAETVFADWVTVNLLHSLNAGDVIAINGWEGGDGRDISRPYTYTSLPPLITPSLTAEIREMPYSTSETATPFSTDYYVVQDLSGMTSLNFTVTASDDTRLVPTDVAGQAAYSNRADLSDTRLTRRFDLSSVDAASLDFRVWYDLEHDWDFGYVMVSRDGETWETLDTLHTTRSDPNAVAYGAGYTGESGGWLEDSASLDAYAGGEVYVRFEMITDDAVNRPGMVIDDVRIDAIGYAENFDAGLGDWASEGWIVTDNRLPARFVVQMAVITDSGVLLSRSQRPGGGLISVALPEDARQAWIMVSPLAPVTTVPVAYSLEVRS